jgi:hypothetical protein
VPIISRDWVIGAIGACRASAPANSPLQGGSAEPLFSRLDQVTIEVTDVRADFAAMVLEFRPEPLTSGTRSLPSKEPGNGHA